MKPCLITILLFACTTSLKAQYYLRGEIRNQRNEPVFHARIQLHSSGILYYSGNDGSFGIITRNLKDSLTISCEGYYTLSIAADVLHYQQIILTSLFPQAVMPSSRLVSITKNLQPRDRKNWKVGSETYSSLVENDFVDATRFPETGFAMHTDKASYSNLRRFLQMHSPVPPDAVRIEELLNYFNFSDVAPPADSTFGFQTVLTACPWNPASQLLFLKVQARKLDPDSIPASNLVFLIDISGSMDLPNRLPLLKSAFKLLVDNLRAKDTVSIVVYGSAVGVWLMPTSGAEKDSIRKAIENLYPGGSTPGASAILSAYQLAKSTFIKGGNNRVILATDGDFNIGYTREEELDALITHNQELGIYLTCLGVGMGNYKDSKLEVLAKKGKGNFAYLDNESEAEKVLVKELTQTLYSVADEAYLNVKFNPEVVSEYRLIGYDNKLKALNDSSSVMGGGEMGSGHSLLAVFELKLRSDSVAAYPVKSRDNLGAVQVNWKAPGDSVIHYTEYTCPNKPEDFGRIAPAYRFATALVWFGSLLKESAHTGNSNFTDVSNLAMTSVDPSNNLQAEFLALVEKARKIYSRQRKNRAKGN